MCVASSTNTSRRSSLSRRGAPASNALKCTQLVHRTPPPTKAVSQSPRQRAYLERRAQGQRRQVNLGEGIGGEGHLAQRPRLGHPPQLYRHKLKTT